MTLDGVSDEPNPGAFSVTKRLALSTLFMMALSTPAFAHLNPVEHGSFAAGFTHPVFGLDHILAMVAVGLWAFQIGGRALLAVPAAFVGAMLGGFALSLSGLALPFVEPAILASVVVLGLVVAMALKADTAVAAILVAIFAVFHGFAHGGEMGAAATLGYGAGFAVSTALLHGAGIGLGFVAARILSGAAKASDVTVRAAGGATVAAGLVLAFAG